MAEHHDLDRFMKETIDINTKWLLKEKDLPQPIDRLSLWSDQGRLEVIAIIVRKGNELREIMHGELPRDTTLPVNGAKDGILRSFLKEHGLRDSEIHWGDYSGLPESLYRMEMIRCAKAVAENAGKKGIAFAPNAKIGIRIEDEDFEDPTAFEAMARRKLQELKPAAARALLSLYYADADATGLLK